MRRFLFAFLLLLPTACGQPSEPAAPGDLEVLRTWMTGSFSSAAQAEADADYFDIRLEMVPIWTERTDGFWLYVEQAAGTALDAPYRQRVYHVAEKPDGGILSEVYELPDPAAFVQAHERPREAFADLEPDALLLREGCGVHLDRTPGGVFEGSTRGKGCRSSLGSAAYATSEVRILEDRIESWDRGFDAEDAQAWGAENGAYIFLRVVGGDEGA